MEKQETTFVEQAEREIGSVLSFEPAGPDDDKRTWYSALFLMDYEIALNSPNTTAEHFVAAYGNRALALKHCKPEELVGRREALDDEAYRLRQKWRERATEN